MRQAGATARDWTREAATFAEERFSHYPPTARARLIASYVQAAAADEVAMCVLALAKELANTVEAMRSSAEELADAAAKITCVTTPVCPSNAEAS
jgi:hypothetical protein